MLLWPMLACIVVAYIVMAYVAMAYVAMTYTIMAYVVLAISEPDGRLPRLECCGAQFRDAGFFVSIF